MWDISCAKENPLPQKRPGSREGPVELGGEAPPLAAAVANSQCVANFLSAFALPRRISAQTFGWVCHERNNWGFALPVLYFEETRVLISVEGSRRVSEAANLPKMESTDA
jgi:hypothetical protein